MRVAIIGGGISGLTALNELEKHGVSARLFEASPRPGGRIMTIRCGNHTIEVGAGYFHKYYPSFLGLLDELGLEGRITTGPRKKMGFVKDGETVLMEPGSLLRAAPFDVLSLAKLKYDAKRNAAKGTAALESYSNGGVAEFPHLMDGYGRSFGDYTSRRTQLVRENIIDPMCRWTLFSPSRDWNYAVGMAILIPMTTPLMKLDGGMDTVTDALYERLSSRIRLETSVKKIEKTPHGYYIQTEDGDDYTFNYVIQTSQIGSAESQMDSKIIYNKTTIQVVRGDMREKYDKGQRTLLSNAGNVDGITSYDGGFFRVNSSKGSPDLGEFFKSYDVLFAHKWQTAVPVIGPDAQFPEFQRDNLFHAGDFYLPCMEMSVATAKKAAARVYADLSK